MTQVNYPGMRLRPAELPHGGWLSQTAIALTACAMVTLSVTQLLEFSGLVMLAAGCCICALYGLLEKFGKQSRFAPCVLILAAVLAIFGRAQLVEGLRLCWNQASAVRAGGTGWVLPELETRLPQQSELCLGLAAVLAGIVTGFLSCLTVSGIIPALLIPGGLLAGMVYLGCDLSFRYLLPVLAAVLLLAGAGWEKRKSILPAAMAWILCGAAAAIFLAAAAIPAVNTWAAQLSGSVRKAIHTHIYETEHTTLPEGGFTSYKEVTGTAKPALTVTMEQPEELYLRGFTGSVLEGDNWKPLETALLAENRDLLYWLNLNAFDPNTQFEASAGRTKTLKNTVTVQNTGACSRYLYVPFGLCSADFLEPENLNNDGVPGNGRRTYSFTTISGGSEEIARILEHLQTSDDPAVLQYRKAESAYREFVHSAYLQIPEDAKTLLGEQWDNIASRYGSIQTLTLDQAQECALLFLGRCFPETGIPEDMALPLDSARGTSYQYATVAALTLRYYGIPARYAEGYVITEEMTAQAQPGEPIRVDGSCTRGWVEVYQDGIGWIPMELTPGIGEILREAPDDSLFGSEEDPDSENENAEDDKETPDKMTEQEMPEGGTVVSILRELLWGFLKYLLLPILLLLLLWLRRKYLLQQKERKFNAENKNDAVAWFFADTAMLLEKLSLDRGSGSMRALCAPAETRFGGEYASRLRKMIDLNDRAIFSSRALEESHRQSAAQFRAETLRLLKTEVKWYRRLWMQWIRCLY